jgi:phage repressor protein C with HTH and peptisase S24 domain
MISTDSHQISEWISHHLKEQRKTKKELADFCGVSAQAVSKWVQTGTITKENLRKTAEFFDVSLETAYGGAESQRFSTIGPNADSIEDNDADFYLIPSYNIAAAAGDGREIYTEQPNGKRAYNRLWLQNEGLDPKFLVMIETDGDSMWPTICDGDSILVYTDISKIIDGEVYVFRVDREIRVKRLWKNMDGTITVTSDNKNNPSFREETFSLQDLMNMNIMGIVVHRAGRIGKRSR